MNQLPVLNYHGIEAAEGEYPWADEEKIYVLNSDNFEAQLREMMLGGFAALGLDGLSGWLNGDAEGNKVVITFDDGHVSHFRHAAPVLKRYGFTAVFFVSGAFVGREGYMDWAQLTEMAAQGFELGSHGMNHIPLTSLSDKEMKGELALSKKILEEKTGVEIRSFSVPRGFYHPRVRNAAEQAGYRFLFTSRFDVNRRRADALSLRRMVVKNDVSLPRFKELLNGKLGAAKFIEAAKEAARTLLPPPAYDRLMDFKRKMREKE